MNAPFLAYSSRLPLDDVGETPENRALSASRLVHVFRRGSVPFDRSDTDSPPSSRRPSVAEVPRRPSRSNFVLRLKGRRKRNQVDGLEEVEAEDDQEHQLGQLIFSLPVEIQSEILRHLHLKDILALRLSSRGAASIVENNATELAKYLFKDLTIADDEAYIKKLFPLSPRIGYLLQLCHRQILVDKLITMLISYIQIKIYMITRNHRSLQFGPYKEQLRRSFHRGAWTICHYLESYRDLVTIHHPEHDSNISEVTQCPECADYITQTLAGYPTEDILPAYHFFSLIVLHLRAATRPPTYAGKMERKFRGWTKREPDEQELGRFTVLGGYSEIVKISMMHGSYSQRLEILAPYYECTTSTDPSLQDEKSFMQELDTPFELVNDHVYRSIPKLKDFFWPEWKAKIMSEVLLESEKDLELPFRYVQQVMSDVDGVVGTV